MKSIRNMLAAALPGALANRCRDARDRIEVARGHYALQQEMEDRPVWRNILSVLRVLFQPGETILFYPERPSGSYIAHILCTWLGYSIVKDPKRRFNAAFKRRNRTFSGSVDLGAVPLAPEKIFNAGCEDISKRTVGRVFADVFGYPLDVDPLTHEGVMVEKSDINATHDGKILEGPLSPERIRAGSVYQKLVNSLSDRPGFYVDYRLAVYGDEIPLVYFVYRDHTDRFNRFKFSVMGNVEDALSPKEIEKTLRFCREIGADFCELDTMRDHDDGCLYITDVNTTSGASVRLLPKEVRREALGRMAPAFDRMLQSRKMQGGRP